MRRRLHDRATGADLTAPASRWPAAADLPAEMLFAPADRQHVTAGFTAALRGDLPPPLQVRLCAGNPAGAPVVALSMAPLHESDGEISGLLLRLTDISVEKRLEAELVQLQKLQAVGQLAGGIAHDFNNLLTAIGGAADRCWNARAARRRRSTTCGRFARAPTGARRWCGSCWLSAGRQPLLPRSRGQCGGAQPVGHVDPIARRAHRGCDWNSRTAGRSVRVDPTQLDQVLINLAVNARDAMPAGGTLTLRNAAT